MKFAVKPYLQTVAVRPDAVIDDEQYPHNIPAIRALGQRTLHADVTLFAGENGAGQSTLLEAITRGVRRHRTLRPSGAIF